MFKVKYFIHSLFFENIQYEFFDYGTLLSRNVKNDSTNSELKTPISRITTNWRT